MKIAVLDNIIDTELIYRISPIKRDGFDDKVYFIIHIFNQKSLNICISIYDKTIIGIEISEAKNKGEYFKKAEKMLEELRNQVIEKWSNNQGDIPRLEFKK